MALSIVVNGGGTFSASMEEGPVSFTASLGAVPGPQGPTGATGPTGVVAATAPILYDSETQTVSIDPYPILTAVELTNGVTTTVVSGSGITFGDDTIQTTAFVGEARREILTARNNTGSTIAKGKVVYLSGATGNKPTVALALATSESTSARTIGITAEAIADNADGKVVISGAVENIDTSAFTAGQVVYLSSSTAGGLQTTLPAAPLHGVVVGIVTRANPSVGSIEVFVQNYQELHELSDVSVSDRANNDGLFYNSSAGVWQARTIAEVLGYTPANNASLASYAPLASPTFTGTVTIPEGASISGFLTTATAASTYAPLASPTFTGTPTLPTGTIGVTQAAGNNTTAIATTAFVQQEVPAASTTVAGKVELADNSEARIATATDRAITPSSFGWLAVRPGFRSLSQINATAVSGSGAVSAGSGLSFGREMVLGSLATGRAAFRMGISGNITGGPLLTRSAINRINFSNKIWMAGTSCMAYQVGATDYRGDAETVCRIMLSGASENNNIAASFKGIGITKVGGVSSFVNLTVHDGTNLTNVATTYANAEAENFEWVIYSDGTGNVTLWINGTQAATTSAGPTGLGNANTGNYFEQVYSAGTPTVRQAMLNAGGWLYIES